MGRFTIPDLLGLPVGVTVFLVVIMGVFALWGAEQIERAMRRKDGDEVTAIDRKVSIGAGVLLVAGLAVMLIGQPTPDQLWQRVAAQKQPLLDQREVQIHPAELRELYYNSQVNLIMLDLRDEADYNLFHIKGAKRVAADHLAGMSTELKAAPSGTVVVVMSNDETLATSGWKTLVAESVPNVYLLEGGLNEYLAVYSDPPLTTIPGGNETLRYEFIAALGGNHPASSLHEHADDIAFTPKVKIEQKAHSGGGGCG